MQIKLELTTLNEKELRNLVLTVAQDFKFKYETLKALYHKEERRIGMTGTASVCFNCSSCNRSAENFLRCDQCDHILCEKCNDDKICEFCVTQKCPEYKLKEWWILCPFKGSQFGYAKYLCQCPQSDDNEAWYLRAVLELHIDFTLKAQVDSARIFNFPICKCRIL
ncbi:unnamed protein product [Thelazia callipaeda]|uniref:RING-type domain-containing protein n=1 Tax=Thelazia callipaeda TaxID=103827 RepID=A0A0N5CQP2_THECL|nr:unnamed protein product [Thelazia callipaeda]